MYYRRSFHLSYRFHLFALSLLLLSTGCDEETAAVTPGIPPVLTPRETYLAALDSSGLAGTEMAKAWIMAGNEALKDSVLPDLPFQETGYFRAETPQALAYRMELTTGELVRIDLRTTPDDLLLFVDLFQVVSIDSTEALRHLYSAENYRTDSLSFEAEQSGTYLLRIQPELLAACRYNLRLIVQPVYGTFPVSGKGNPDIWSFYGDPRDGGNREHKGVDIFARRGTPVVAAVDGEVRRVRNRGLGGKQVWLSDHQRRQSLYYAHLDSQLVREGQRVIAGDTLGLVGNTGNARNTRPHLHFSIYRRGSGAIDPYPFIAFRTKEAPAVRADTSSLGQVARVRQSNTPLLAAPENRSPTLATLDRHLPLQIIAASKTWYRVRSPEGSTGYLPNNSVEDIDRPLSNFALTEATELLRSPDRYAAPVSALSSGTEVAVIGTNGAFQLVRDPEGKVGWLPASGK